MYLQALTVGRAVPIGGFDASVHSIFQSSLNLQLSRVNCLLTLTVLSEDDLPQGIRLDAPKGFTFEKFQMGEPAVCRDGLLYLEKTSLTVQLHGARRYECDLPGLMVDISSPVVSAAWRTVWEALNKRQRLSKAEIIAEEMFDGSARGTVSRKSGEAMRDLLRVTQKHEGWDTTAISALLGLGPGLTPSGDDLLVGYLAGLWSTMRYQTKRRQSISSLGKSIIRLSRRTNDISRTYLYHAARGQVSSRLAGLVETIRRGTDSARLLEFAEFAMQVGHTSGMDAVTGLLAGLTAWEGDHLISI